VLIVTAYDSFVEDPRLRQADGYVIKSFGALDELKEKIVDILSWETTPEPNKKNHSTIEPKGAVAPAL
jgi:hypothetical protein